MKTINTKLLKKNKITLSVNFLLTIIFTSMLLLPGFQASAQPAPSEVAVRFANPGFDCETKTYCLDVEFMANMPGEELFGINVRFYYDNLAFDFLAFDDFQGGYTSPDLPEIISLQPGGGQSSFGFSGDGAWLNGVVQLEDANGQPIYLLTDQWTKLFKVCFSVKPAYWGLDEFCPSIVWDLTADAQGGFGFGSDGVVITLVDNSNGTGSKPTDEEVVQFNWEYSEQPGLPYGLPNPEICVNTVCIAVPLSGWALYTAIFLILATLAIRFRRFI